MRKEKVLLRTPITYYGGKQQLCSTILGVIPEHNLYCEPFCGGAAVFFGKEPSNVEILNDTNKELINFYKVAQNNFIELEKLIRVSLHSRLMHDDAHVIYKKPHLFNDVRRAWALWVLANQSHTSNLDNSWGYERKTNRCSKKVQNKKVSFTEDLAIRLQNVQIECADALYVIQSRDCKEAFFYIDPPYIGTNLGHYDGYSEADYKKLLEVLGRIEGKFLLSSFPTDILNEHTEQNGWNVKELTMTSSASSNRKKKVEVLTANYDLNAL